MSTCVLTSKSVVIKRLCQTIRREIEALINTEKMNHEQLEAYELGNDFQGYPVYVWAPLITGSALNTVSGLWEGLEEQLFVTSHFNGTYSVYHRSQDFIAGTDLTYPLNELLVSGVRLEEAIRLGCEQHQHLLARQRTPCSQVA